MTTTCAFSEAAPCSRLPKYRVGDGFVCGEHIDWALTATLDPGESIRVHRLPPDGNDSGSDPSADEAALPHMHLRRFG